MNKKLDGYAGNVSFWNKKQPKVIGDLLGRKQVLDMLKDIKNKKILDSGCGSGYMARRLAKKGAKLWGCDTSKGMLSQAQNFESTENLGIQYKHANIIKTGYPNSFFDIIVSTGVLIANNKLNIEKFFKETHRILKKDGKLIFYVTHPFMYTEFSPARNKKEKNWVHFTPLKNKNYDCSAPFIEDYFDIQGNKFTTTSWHHSVETYILAILKSGLKIMNLKELILEKKHLISPFLGKTYGYPAFLLVEVQK